MNTYVNDPNLSLKSSTTMSDVFTIDEKSEIISDDRVMVTKTNNICQCGRLHCPKTMDTKSISANFSYDNMGYG